MVSSVRVRYVRRVEIFNCCCFWRGEILGVETGVPYEKPS